MINLIIPCYNNIAQLKVCLSSIITQSTVNRFRVILCDDASTFENNELDLLVQFFNQHKACEMIVLNNPTNGGPGLARNVGLNYLYSLPSNEDDYVMFMDSDDILFCATNIAYFQDLVARDVYEHHNPQLDKVSQLPDIYSFAFLGELVSPEGDQRLLQKHEMDDNWLHGKLYSINYLKSLDLKFPNLRCHEDVYFNLVAFESTQSVIFYNEIAMMWKYWENSLSSKNDMDSRIDKLPLNLHSVVQAYDTLSNTYPNIKTLKTFVINAYYFAQYCEYYGNTKNYEEILSLCKAFLSDKMNLLDLSEVLDHIITTRDSFIGAYGDVPFKQDLLSFLYDLNLIDKQTLDNTVPVKMLPEQA